jgi:hypothetical protein
VPHKRSVHSEDVRSPSKRSRRSSGLSDNSSGSCSSAEREPYRLALANNTNAAQQCVNAAQRRVIELEKALEITIKSRNDAELSHGADSRHFELASSEVLRLEVALQEAKEKPRSRSRKQAKESQKAEGRLTPAAAPAGVRDHAVCAFSSSSCSSASCSPSSSCCSCCSVFFCLLCSYTYIRRVATCHACAPLIVIRWRPFSMHCPKDSRPTALTMQ